MFPNVKTIFMTKNYRSSGNILKASNSLIDKNENRIKKDLITNSDLKDESDKVKMMTIHTAKGLEFPYVFIAGLNEGIFPSSRVRTKDEMEEERRLADRFKKNPKLPEESSEKYLCRILDELNINELRNEYNLIVILL